MGQLLDGPALVDLTLPAALTTAGQARRAIRSRFGWLDPDRLEVLVLMVSELVGNSLRHGGLGPDDRIGLRARTSGGWIRVEVVDRGRRFDPQIPVRKGPDEASGWGLFTVDRMADRWGIIEGADRCIWFELRVPDGHSSLPRDATPPRFAEQATG